MRRSVLGVATVVLMAAGLLTGCSDNKSDASNTEAPVSGAKVTGVVTFSGRAATYEVSVDNQGRILMLDIKSTKGDQRGKLAAVIIGDNEQTTCRATKTSALCVYDKPKMWRRLIPLDITDTETPWYNQKPWYNPYVQQVPASKVSVFPQYKSFVFLGEAASFSIEMDKNWKITDVTTLSADNNSRLNIDADGHNTECFAGDVCSYFKEPKVFDKLVETDAGGVGVTLTLNEIKALPRY